MTDNPYCGRRIWSAVYGTRAFLRSDPYVGIGGLALDLSQTDIWGIPDTRFRANAARHRNEPEIKIGLAYARLPGELTLLPSLFSSWRGGELPGAPDPVVGRMRSITSRELLEPLLPIYALPACDAVSVDDFVLLLDRLATDETVSLCWRAGGRTPRRPAESKRRAAHGAVTPDHLEEFANKDRALEGELFRVISWQRRGWRAFSPAKSANAVASHMLGIPVDLRLGALVRPWDVTDVIRLAAGCPQGSEDGSPYARLRAFVRQLVPKVPRRPVHGCYMSLRGRAWSVALDGVLNAPIVWLRDAEGNLPCLDGRPAAPRGHLDRVAGARSEELRKFLAADPECMARA